MNHAKDSRSTSAPIDPKELIERYSVEELNQFSDLYYQRLPLPEFQLGKPFSMATEAPQHLIRLGLILENFRIGPGSRVLDFGAGTCWIAKALWQMGCDVTAVDVSEEALRIGRKLFEEYPIPICKNGDWRLKRFDGHRLPLEDRSIDRIICYDTFHHVPNQETVVAEFARVLADGGLIAFNEPIGQHSKSEASQREMRNYTVLENDLHIDELIDQFARYGFTRPQFKIVPQSGLTLNLDQWKAVRNGHSDPMVASSLSEFAQNTAILFLQKGQTRLDSRCPDGLSHHIEAERVHLKTKVDQAVWIPLRVENTGSATWLHGTGTRTGIVNVGTQRINPDTEALIAEHARFHFNHDIQPGEIIEMKVPIQFAEAGQHTIRLDLVSELVTWFHQRGSEPIYLEATVSD